MSTKRKSIVFDLEDNKKAKVGRSPHRVAYRNDVTEENPQADFVSHMQPEILTMSFMLELLTQCHVRSSCLTGKSKEEIQKLFLEYVTPKPQRHYKNTRVGKVLSAMQEKYACSQTPDWQSQVMASSGSISAARPRTNLASLLPASASSDRLKPPVASLINTERKTIKLGGSRSAAAKDRSGVKSSITLTANKTSDLDKIDLLLKPRLKAKEEDNLKVEEALLNPSSKRIITLNKSKGDTVSKKLKVMKEGATNSDSSNSKASTSPGKHSSVAWP